jgi:CheY-like chemotaxis protein
MLELIQQNPRELVSLDLQMPILDGFSVIREWRNDARFRHLAVVAVTASAMLGERERPIVAGFDSYIAKPINLVEVRKQVDLLSSRRPDLTK